MLTRARIRAALHGARCKECRVTRTRNPSKVCTACLKSRACVLCWGTGTSADGLGACVGCPGTGLRASEEE